MACPCGSGYPLQSFLPSAVWFETRAIPAKKDFHYYPSRETPRKPVIPTQEKSRTQPHKKPFKTSDFQ
ncbi:hypothetical protein SAMN04487935_3164 [Flavobacterium noncentrifugens]|uniref:Uncharacterized protein n=1 Tax=Flavobacterium noncentrifugens TaxID=1128970 RepID=A0A1G9B2D0_9FLAO|nr:hypothetical protein SAMN04487935_3164 [Flavobacterium noncentrifugens]